MKQEIKIIEHRGDYVKIQIGEAIQLWHWTQATALLTSVVPARTKIVSMEKSRSNQPTLEMLRSAQANQI